MEEEKSENQTNNRPWLFKKGQSGNPAGRPKGKSLKEYSREYLASMTEEERQEFLEGIPKADIWRMAEGNPHQTSDVKSDTTLNFKPFDDVQKDNNVPESKESPETN